MTPAQVWEELVAGNRRFASEETAHPHQDVRRRAAVAHDPAPMAVVLGCMDSRAPVELVFDVGVGDVFSIRTPGVVLTPNTLGGIALVCELPSLHLVVVLGHNDCKAAEAAADIAAGGVAAAPSPEVAGLAHTLAPAVAHAGGPGVGKEELALAQIGLSVDAVRAIDAVERRMATGTLGLVSAQLDIATGIVRVLTTEGA